MHDAYPLTHAQFNAFIYIDFFRNIMQIRLKRRPVMLNIFNGKSTKGFIF